MNYTGQLDLKEPVIENQAGATGASPNGKHTALLLSVVIPVFNEVLVLKSVVEGITSRISDMDDTYELILYENGSTDGTLELAHQLAEQYPQVVVFTSPKASYGAAVKNGILATRGEHIVVFNADFWDIPFLRKSRELLHQYDMVIASKLHPDSEDNRPFVRRFITWGFNKLLQVLFGFAGSDTHGIKAFRRSKIIPIIEQCVTDGEIFDTEVILRGERAGLKSVELPMTVEETRPSRYSLFARVPRTFRDLKTLYRALQSS